MRTSEEQTNDLSRKIEAEYHRTYIKSTKLEGSRFEVNGQPYVVFLKSFLEN